MSIYVKFYDDYYSDNKQLYIIFNSSIEATPYIF